MVQNFDYIGSDKMIDDLKMYYGLPPHNTWTNFCAHDSWFAEQIKDKYGDYPNILANKIGLKVKNEFPFV